MATVKYYLDKKPDKKGDCTIELHIHCDGRKIKKSTGQKVQIKDFDTNSQEVKDTSLNHIEINHYLNYLRERANELLNNSYKKKYSY